jgi:hypothetical protein
MSKQKRESVVLTDAEVKSLQIAAGVFADKLWFPDEMKREAADAIFNLLDRTRPKPTPSEAAAAFHREPNVETREALWQAIHAQRPVSHAKHGVRYEAITDPVGNHVLLIS